MEKTAMNQMLEELIAHEWEIPMTLIVKAKELVQVEKEQIIDVILKQAQGLKILSKRQQNNTTMEHMGNQTAVDWYYEQTVIQGRTNYAELLEQAKQMEEQQHQETFKQSRQAKIFEDGMPPVWESFEHYYNTTYGIK